jgi:hypothetical protein
MEVKDPNHVKVIVLFSAVAALSTAIMLLLALSGHWLTLVLPTPVLFVLATWAASREGFLPFPPSRLVFRGWASGLVFASSYLVGLFLSVIVFVGLAPSQSLDFDDHRNDTFSPFETFRNQIAVPVGVLVGAIAVFLISALAVKTLTGKWPKRFLRWTFTTPILVLLLIMTVAPVVSAVSWGAWGGIREEFSRILLARAPGDVPLILFIGQPILGAIVGHWIFTSSEDDPPKVVVQV